MLARGTEPGQSERLIKRIEDAAWRGADLTRRLLAFGRRQPLNPQPLDVTQLVSGLSELMRHGLRSDIRLETRFAQELWPVRADASALELALLNLAVNARDAMPEGGRLTFAAANVPASEVPPDLPQGDYVAIQVSDTGMGMGPEVLSRVFEPFFTTKEQGKGTGLGLAQVYGFARQSGGTACVESRLGAGTTVTILLPRAAEAPAQTAEQDRPRPEPIGPAEHLSVLVVEDEDDVAASVMEMLSRLGHRPIRVASVPAALARLGASNGVDLVFSDVLLREAGSGLDLAREVMARSRRVPILLTSGFGGGMSRRLAGSDLPFLHKPYTIDQLREAITQAMQRR